MFTPNGYQRGYLSADILRPYTPGAAPLRLYSQPPKILGVPSSYRRGVKILRVVTALKPMSPLRQGKRLLMLLQQSVTLLAL